MAITSKDQLQNLMDYFGNPPVGALMEFFGALGDALADEEDE